MKRGTITHFGMDVLTVALDGGNLELKGEGLARDTLEWMLETWTDFVIFSDHGTGIALLPVRGETFEEFLRLVAAVASNTSGETYRYGGWMVDVVMDVPLDGATP